MNVSATERAELRRQGAKAAARGDAVGSNPMLRAINLPSRTGESDQLWSCRRDAWRQGYERQSVTAVSRPGSWADEDRSG